VPDDSQNASRVQPPVDSPTADMKKAYRSSELPRAIWASKPSDESTIQAWRVTWIDPVTGRRDALIGRWSGKDVVQAGTRADGTPVRWMFTEITPESFHWSGEALQPDGKTWKLEGGFRARRTR